MKISKYKVFDASTAVVTGADAAAKEASVFALGKLDPQATADASIRWAGIPVKDISSIVKEAAVAADDQYEATVTFATAPAAAGGETFTVTVQYPDSRQRVRKVFKHVTPASPSVTTIAVAIKDLINASDIPFTASNSSGVLTLVADTAGAGYEPSITGGTDSATTTVAVARTVTDKQRTDAAYFAAKHDHIDAADFGSATDDYIAYYVKYTELIDTAHGKALEERCAALFVDGATTLTELEAALNANYSVTASDGGAKLVEGNQTRYDLLS